MSATELTTYLNDHLAGSVAALELLDDLVAHPAEPDDRAYFTELRSDIAADQDVLRALLSEIGSGESSVRKAAGWLAEKLPGSSSAGMTRKTPGSAASRRWKRSRWASRASWLSGARSPPSRQRCRRCDGWTWRCWNGERRRSTPPWIPGAWRRPRRRSPRRSPTCLRSRAPAGVRTPSGRCGARSLEPGAARGRTCPARMQKGRPGFQTRAPTRPFGARTPAARAMEPVGHSLGDVLGKRLVDVLEDGGCLQPKELRGIGAWKPFLEDVLDGDPHARAPVLSSANRARPHPSSSPAARGRPSLPRPVPPASDRDPDASGCRRW